MGASKRPMKRLQPNPFHQVHHGLPPKEDFEAYERVRVEGRFNMFDPRAQQLTGLTKEEYVAVMDRYSELMEKYPDVRR